MSTSAKASFNYGLFEYAMLSLIGRDPDFRVRLGLDGHFTIRYKPANAEEVHILRNAVITLQEWLSIFDLIPFRSRCEYGRLPHPSPEEEGQDFLEIIIVHRVKRP